MNSAEWLEKLHRGSAGEDAWDMVYNLKAAEERIVALEKEKASDKKWIQTYADINTRQSDKILMLENRIAALEARLRWIPVEERLPDTDRQVLVASFKEPQKWKSVDRYMKSGEWLECYGITHWMEIPWE